MSVSIPSLVYAKGLCTASYILALIDKVFQPYHHDMQLINMKYMKNDEVFSQAALLPSKYMSPMACNPRKKILETEAPFSVEASLSSS